MDKFPEWTENKGRKPPVFPSIFLDRKSGIGYNTTELLKKRRALAREPEAKL